MRIWLGLTLSLAACSLIELDDLGAGSGSTAGPGATSASASTGPTSSSVATSASSVGASSVSASSGAGGAHDAYQDAVLASQPMAYYRFDDPDDSTTIADALGTLDIAYDGPLERRIPGAFAGSTWAVRFDGSGRGKLPPGFEFPGTVPFSIELWFRLPSVVELRFLLSNDTGVFPDRRGYTLVTYRDDSETLMEDGRTAIGLERWGFDAGAQVAPGALTGHEAVLANQWYHFVVTWDGDQHAAYLNGQPGLSHGPVVELPDDMQPAWLAADGDGNSQYVGDLDELAIYARALTGTEVAAHFAAAN